MGRNAVEKAPSKAGKRRERGGNRAKGPAVAPATRVSGGHRASAARTAGASRPAARGHRNEERAPASSGTAFQHSGFYLNA